MKKLLTNPRYFWPLVVFVYIAARLGTWVYPFDSDHWIFYYVGRIWAEGGTLYVAAWDHKPPLIFAANGFMHMMFGGNIVWHRIWFTLLSFVDIALFWQLLKHFLPDLLTPRVIPAKAACLPARQGIQSKEKGLDSSSRAGMTMRVALLLYVIWRNLSHFTSSGNNTENLGLIFFIGMLLSFLSFRRDGKWWKMLISGTCFSMLFFLKGNFLLLGIPLGVVLLVDNWKSIRKFFGYGIIFVLPLAIQASFWSYYFISKHAFNDFFVASFQFSAKYSSSAWKGNLSDLSVFYMLIAIASPLIILGPILFVADTFKTRTTEFLFWALMLVCGSFAFFSVGVPYPYYFEIMMPVYIIAATYLIFRGRKGSKFIYWGYIIAFTFAMLLNFGFSTFQIRNTIGGNVKTEADEYREIATYVQENTTPSDKVFAYDYGATFYQLAERDSGSRFISASVLLLENRDNYGLGFDDMFISDMEKSQAKYVVAYKDRDTLYYQNKPVVEYFDSHYLLDKEFTKFVVLKRK